MSLSCLPLFHYHFFLTGFSIYVLKVEVYSVLRLIFLGLSLSKLDYSMDISMSMEIIQFSYANFV